MLKNLIIIIVLFLTLNSIAYGQEEACVYVLSQKIDLHQIISQSPNERIVFQDNNLVHWTTTPESSFPGWDIVYEWSDPYPEKVKSGEIIDIGFKGSVQNAGPGFVGPGIGTYVEGIGNGNRIHNNSAGAGRGSNGQVYGQDNVSKYEVHFSDEPEIIISVYLKDGNALDVLLAKYIYKKQSSGSTDNQQYNLVPMVLYWSSDRGDNFTSPTQTGKEAALAAGYTVARTEGYIFSSQEAGTVPLKLYWSPERGDNFSTATIQGENDAIAAGYTFVRIEFTISRSPCGFLRYAYLSSIFSSSRACIVPLLHFIARGTSIPIFRT